MAGAEIPVVYDLGLDAVPGTAVDTVFRNTAVLVVGVDGIGVVADQVRGSGH